MNERVLHVLEFDKIIEQLMEQAETSLGKEKAAQISPETDLDKVNQLQEETDEAAQIHRLNKVIPFGGIRNIRESLKRSVIGSILSAAECLDTANTMYGGRQVKNFLEDLEEEIPILKQFAEDIDPMREIEREIRRAIDENGDVLDNASSKLRGIRSQIRTFEASVREKLEGYTRSHAKMLSDAIVTIRNDRYVLPVKQEYRAQVGGIVHDQSSSGQTLFMEPRAVVDLNNKLQQAFLNERQEIERILTELTSQIAEVEPRIAINLEILATIDFIAARAKLASRMKASKPRMNDKGIIKMKQARHPLIPDDQVVANDIELGKDYTAIVITGPNTGGKTVTLKMVGLCTLMAQSGLQVPAFDDCELAVFQTVFADIGDEQSIEQNLSTFSSHMKNIVTIMEEVDDKSLVLFDELGSGTDPSEGAALAMALLDEVIARRARVIATTHYPELKAYGYNRDHVINASADFDVESLKPTYRLLIGVPGRSNAFEISRRLGLQDELIDKAKSLVGIDSKSVENMIASLEKSQIAAEKQYEEAHGILLESEKVRDEIEKEWQTFERKKEELYRKAEEKAEKALKQAREEAEIIVEEIRNMKMNAGLKEHEWIEARKMLEEAQPQLTSKSSSSKQEISEENRPLAPGDDIKLLTVNQQGVVLEQLNEQEYMVQVGIMKVKAKRKDLQYVGRQKQDPERTVATIRGSNAHVKTELDLRGERFEDALHRLEKYVDDALLAGYGKVTIIHGKGTGALRSGVQDFAKQHPAISSARFGGSGEGGSGVTVLELK
ncbi:endonuclease MutS2 [Oceanobacillus alkalisoli]|uniref:endonuclease MutS2 n=1 Tax=Oceanobacillus alkalisoli TaxID=2925113 RepID=UPI001EE436CA|nr:endonuclease MutS2 [Oceanobacillus alkalisoli]MCG5104308.1 endonuclease MutS2 [Oceanobacillus alkalisoli]